MKCLFDCVSVRLSGRSSVLQVQRGGVWRTVCSEGWNNLLGLSACKQLGYSRSSRDTDPHPQIWIVLHGSELCVALSHVIIKTTRTQCCLLELQRSDPQPSVLCVRYVESFFVALTSIEQDLQFNLVSLNLSQSQIIKLQNATSFR